MTDVDLDAIEAWCAEPGPYGLPAQDVAALVKRIHEAEKLRERLDNCIEEWKNSERFYYGNAAAEKAEGVQECIDDLERALNPEPAALAWTPDEDVEAGIAQFKEDFPEQWEAWLAWCREQDKEGS